MMQPDKILVDSFYLADRAQVVDGKLYVLGGGWNYLNLAGPDAQVEFFALVGRVLVPFEIAENDIDLEIRLVHSEVAIGGPQFRLLLRPGLSARQRRSVETATPFAIDVLGLNFPWEGEYAFVMLHAENEVARTRFQVNFVDRDHDKLNHASGE
jgi:uncharacterized protein DUF6941